MAHSAITRSVTPLSLDSIRRIAPSIFAEQARGDRSEKYTFIPTIDVVKGLLREGFEIYSAGQTITRNADRTPFAKHLLRLRKSGQQALRQVGDEFPEIILTNSHDGASAFQLTAGIFRLVCLNGMVAGRDFGEIRVRHSGNVVDNVIEGSFRVVDDLKLLGERVEQYSSIQLAAPEQIALADSAITARWGDNKVVDAHTVLRANRPADVGNDLWRTFNRIQENVTKGGQAGRAASGRRLTTRAVNSVNTDTNLNRALFELADTMAKLKAA